MKTNLSIVATTVTCCALASILSGCRAAESGSAGSTATTKRVDFATNVDASYLTALDWRFVGPPRGGRAPAVVGDPQNPLVFYFGASHGGVWKTEDAGTYWRNVSDGFFNTAPVGAIDVSPSNPAVVYVGTGEACPRQDLTPGDGVYKSTDGGQTWTNVGLKETRHIAKIKVHPRNPDIVYVAAAGDVFGTNPERGVFRTKDGGKTWQRVLFKSDSASAVDFSMDPTNPNVMYAALDRLQRLPWDEISGGPDSGLYKSTDGGDTWTDITHNSGLPKGIVGRIVVSVSAARPSRVWALVEADDGALFRSDDSGQTWTRITERRDFRRDASSFMHVIADTQDPDTVYVQHYTFWKSTDAGATFNAVPMPHGDHHSLWIDPRNNQRIIEGSDGGAAVSLNGGRAWSSLYNQPTACLFSLAIDNESPYWIFATQNDNSHFAMPSRTGDAAIAWKESEPIDFGEGGQTAVKPDGSVVYAGDRTNIARWDRRTGQAPTISVWPMDQFSMPPKDVKYRFYYTFPILLSPHDPGVLYTAGNRVFRTTDEGYSWEPISPDLTRNRVDKMQQIPGRPITSFTSSLYWVSLAQSIAESPLEKGELWFGSDDTTLQLTRNGGTTWENVTPKDLPEWTTISGIDVSPHDRGTAYIAAHRYKVSDRSVFFYKTTDYGRTWQKITNGIRQNDFARVIREDPVRPGLLYAGTETGVYVSFDAGGSWQPLQRNLPVVPVHFMLVKGNDLVLATHGRGLWIMDNLSALRQITPQVTSATAHLFDIEPTYRYLPMRTSSARSARPGIQLTGSSGDVVAFEDRQSSDGRVRRTFLNAGQNPPAGVIVDYYLKQRPASETKLAVVDANGHVIQEFSSSAKDALSVPADAGMNRFIWDLRYPGPRELPPNPMFGAQDSVRPQAPVAPPGRYRARLTVDGASYEAPFEIKKDPRLTASDADLEEQFAFMLKVRDQISDITDTVNRIHEIRKQLDERAPAAGAPRAQATAAAKEKLLAIEGAITRVLGPNPNLVPPRAPDNQLAALSGVITRADGKPTRSMNAVFDELATRVAEQKRRLDQTVSTDIKVILDRGTQ